MKRTAETKRDLRISVAFPGVMFSCTLPFSSPSLIAVIGRWFLLAISYQLFNIPLLLFVLYEKVKLRLLTTVASQLSLVFVS